MISFLDVFLVAVDCLVRCVFAYAFFFRGNSSVGLKILLDFRKYRFYFVSALANLSSSSLVLPFEKSTAKPRSNGDNDAKNFSQKMKTLNFHRA